jgi:hypothetical protein
MPTDEQIEYMEQRHAALDEALDREITFLRKQEATIPTISWQKERQVLLANVAMETILRLYADTLPDALRFRVYELTDVRSALLCRGIQHKREVQS